MVRLYLTLTNEQREELKEHLSMNGYNVEWVTDDVIEVDEEEKAYVTTILYDRYISFTDNKNEQFFGDDEVKSKIDTFYNLAEEILCSIGDICDYSDEENKMIEEIANVVNIYEEVFSCN